MYKQSVDYWKKHPYWNMTAHFLLGLGVGLLIARPYVIHPLRWGWGLVLAGLLIHIKVWVMGKK